MITDKIWLDKGNQLHLGLLKYGERELGLIRPKNLERLNLNYSISRVSDPEKEITEIMAIPGKLIRFINNHLYLSFSLTDLLNPENCQISIKELSLILKKGKKISSSIQKTYPFLKIQSDDASDLTVETVEDSEDVTMIINTIRNEDIIKIFKGRKNTIKSRIELVPLSEDLEFCEMMEDMGEISEVFKKKSNEIKDLITADLNYSLIKKLLECLFLFVSRVTDLGTFKHRQIKEIGVRIIQKYFEVYFNA